MDKYAIGIDLGGTKIIAGIVDIQTGEVLYTLKKKTGISYMLVFF